MIQVICIPQRQKNDVKQTLHFATIKECAAYFGTTDTKIRNVIRLGYMFRGYFFDEEL